MRGQHIMRMMHIACLSIAVFMFFYDKNLVEKALSVSYSVIFSLENRDYLNENFICKHELSKND